MVTPTGGSTLATRNVSFHGSGLIGAFFAPVKLAFALSLTLIGILIFAWMVDLVFVFRVWPDGIDRLKSILNADLARALRFAQWQGIAPERVTGAANLVFEVVFKATGIHDMGMRFAKQEALSIPDTIVRSTYVANREVIEVMMVGTHLLAVRLSTLLMFSPIIVLTYIVAAADGLTQRAIRRVSGGRESASLYHRGKRLQFVLAACSILTSLLLPISLDPRFIWLPVVISLAILVRIQWSFYKKHL